MVESFRRGEFVGLASVEKFVKGFDVPDVMAMIGARPYSSSLASVIQQLGRGMRIAPGKEFALYLDHAQNMAGWYEDVCDIWENGVDHFPEKNNDKQTRREGEQQADVICSGCKFVLPKGAAVCPYCGTERRRRQTKAQKVSGRMEEVTRPGSREWQENNGGSGNNCQRLHWNARAGMKCRPRGLRWPSTSPCTASGRRGTD